MNNPLAAVASLFRPKPSERPHKERRYYAATKAENAAARQKRADVRLELAVYAALTTPEQRKAEADAFHEQFMREWRAARTRASIGEGRGQ